METIKNRLLDVVLGVLVAISLAIAGWCVKAQVAQGQLLAAMQQSAKDLEQRVNSLESRGSRSLEAHVKDDDTRVANLKDQVTELKTSTATLLPLPGKLEAINVKIDGIKEGTMRVEAALNEARRTLLVK